MVDGGVRCGRETRFGACLGCRQARQMRSDALGSGARSTPHHQPMLCPAGEPALRLGLVDLMSLLAELQVRLYRTLFPTGAPLES